MISIWANFNAQSFIHPKLSMQSSELFLYVSTCLQQQWTFYYLHHTIEKRERDVKVEHHYYIRGRA